MLDTLLYPATGRGVEVAGNNGGGRWEVSTLGLAEWAAQGMAPVPGRRGAASAGTRGDGVLQT